MSLKPKIATIALAFFLAGCDDETSVDKVPEASSVVTKRQVEEEPKPTELSKPTRSVTEQAISEDWSYQRVCSRFRKDLAKQEECRASIEIRTKIAKAQASTTANLKTEQFEQYGYDVLETALKPEIIEEAESRKLDQIPVELAGLELGTLPGLPDYFEVKGGIFGYRSEVGLSAVIIGKGSEITVSIDHLDKEQREFLEHVCNPELNWRDSTCQGVFFVAVAEGEQFVELKLVGAKLTKMDKKALEVIELKKMW